MGLYVRALEADRTLLECYRTDEHKLHGVLTDLQGELRLAAAGATVNATLVATRGDFYDANAKKMQWAGTGRRVRDRLELVLDRTGPVFDPAVPPRVLYNADISNGRVHGLVFEPDVDADWFYGSLVMDGCYRAGDVDVPAQEPGK